MSWIRCCTLLFIALPLCYSLTGGGGANQRTWRKYHYRSVPAGEDVASSLSSIEDRVDGSLPMDNVQSGKESVLSNTTPIPPTSSLMAPNQPQIPSVNSTISGPHLVVSGRLVRPQSHHSSIIGQPQPLIAQPQTSNRAPSNSTTQLRGPNFYYGTPLVVNHTIPIPHTPSSWRMAATPKMVHQNQPILRQFPAGILGQNASQILQPAQQFINSTMSAIASHMTGQTPQNQSSTPTSAQTSKTLATNPSGLSQSSTVANKQATTTATGSRDEDQSQGDSSDDGAHRSLFSGLGSSLFGGGGKKLLLKEKEDEYEEVVEIPKGGKKEKLLSKLAGKKEKLKEKGDGYDDEYGEEVLVKPGKAKTLKLKPKLKGKEKIVVDEYGGGGYEPEPSYGGGGGYGAAAYGAPPAPYPSYPVASYPKGKYVPQYRQSTTNGTTVILNGTLTKANQTETSTNQTISSRAIQSKIIMPGYLTQDIPISSFRLNSNQTQLIERSNQNSDSGISQKSYAAGGAYPASSTYGAAALAVPLQALAAAAFPAPSYDTSAAYPPPAYSAPAADYGAAPAYGVGLAAAPAYGAAHSAYGAAPSSHGAAPAYGVGLAHAYGAAPAYGAEAAYGAAPAYGAEAAYGAAPAYGAAAASSYGSPPYPVILGKVLEQYPAQASYSVAAGKYDYSLPVGVVNIFCGDPKYPCSCTLYLTEISSYNLLISGVCSGLPKEKYFTMNLFESGDLTAGCNSLGLYLLPSLAAGGYRSHGGGGGLIAELGLIKSDYHGVAFVNKLKHANMGIMCDKYGYGYKTSILGRAIGLTEALVPTIALAHGYGAPPLAPLAPVVAAGYRRNAIPLGHAQPLLPNVVACGVIGLANKDNSYETRQLKSRLVANAEVEEQNAKLKPKHRK